MTTTHRTAAQGLYTTDLQASLPAMPISLTKAGVTRSAKSIRITHGGDERLFHAEVECHVDLDPRQKGVHMSRFEEVVNEAIDEVVIGEALVIEALAERIAQLSSSGRARFAARSQSEPAIRSSGGPPSPTFRRRRCTG